MERTRHNIQYQINLTAKQFVFTHGVRGWSMDEFAAEAGITKRTLYKYVASKEKLVQQALIQSIRDIIQTIEQLLSSDPHLEAGIDHIVNAYSDLVQQMDTRMIHDIFKQYPHLESIVVNERKQLTNTLVSYLQKAQQNGIINHQLDCNVLVEAIQALVIYHLKNHPKHLSETLPCSIHLLVHGILPRKDHI